MTIYLPASIFLLFASSLAAAQAAPYPDATALQKTLEVAQRRDQLEMPGGIPFHLHASFEWTSPDGSRSGKGALDELWQDAHHWRQEIDLPHKVLVELDNESTPWRTGEWSAESPVFNAIALLLRPFNDPPPTTPRVEMTHDAFAAANPTLDCIGTEPDLPNIGMDVKLAQTTYCLARGNHLLRIISRPDWIVALNEVKPFENKYIARSIELSRHGFVYLHLRVDSLVTASDFSILDAPIPDEAQRLPFHRADQSPRLSTQIFRGQTLQRSAPMMPPLGHEGRVDLKFHIDTNGNVVSAQVVSSENKFLDNAALLAVKQWHYRVSYQGDHIVDVDDTFTINFKQPN